MSTKTTNLNLTLPEPLEGYDIAVVNANNEAIDEAVGALQAEVGTGKVDAIQTDVADIKTKVTATNTTVGTINTNLTTASGKIDTVDSKVAGVKTVADANATKLTNLKTVTDATKTAVDTINTNTAYSREQVGYIHPKIDAISTNASSTKTTAETINSKIGSDADLPTSTIMGKLNSIRSNASNTKTDTTEIKATLGTVNTNTASAKTTAETINAKVGETSSTAETTLFGNFNVLKGRIGGNSDTGNTVFGLLNQLKTSVASLTTALATANSNIATLLTNSKGVKAITSGTAQTDADTGYTVAVNIPTTMNPDKVVVLATAYSAAWSEDSGLNWTRAGRVVTFKCYGKTITYQFIEFY